MNKAYLWLLLAMTTIAGCASRPEYAIKSSSEFDGEKIFAVGDCFELRIGGQTVEFTIGGDGTIELPLIAHRVRVAGLTPRQVAKVVSESYQPHPPRESEIGVLPCLGSRR